MVEVRNIMLTSFKMSHAGTAIGHACNPAAGHQCPMLLPETPGHSRASLGQSLCGHCSFFLGPGVHKVLLVPTKSLFSQPCEVLGSSVVGLMATFSKMAYAIPRSTAPRTPALAAVHC